MTTNFTADPAVTAAAEAAKQLTARTRNLEILTPEGFTEAAETLKVIKGGIAQIDEAEERIKRPLMNALAEVRLQATQARTPFLENENRIKAAILTYTQTQERIRQAEQRRQDEIARKERERLEEVGRQARAKAAQEAQARREEAARIEAEDAAAAQRLREQAARIENKAEAKADRFESRAAQVVSETVQSETPKVAGVKMRDNWCWRLKDKVRLAEGFKTSDDAKITRTVKSLKLEALDLIGREAIEIFNNPVIASGT